MADITNIAGRINSISQEGVAVVASQTLDERKNKKQSVVNQETDEALANHVQRIGTLEEEVGSGGSVDERIAQAKSEAESDIKGGASSDYDTLKKTEDAIKAEAAARQEDDSSLDGRMRTLEDNSVRYTPQTPSQTEQAQARTNLDTYSKDEVNQIATAFTAQNYVTVQAVAATTAADIPTLINATGDGEQTYTLYRVGWFDGTAFDVTKYSEYTWNGTAYIQMAVRSTIGEVFDISVYNQSGGTPVQYETLALALGTNGANVPSGVRQGGMSVKFIQSSDNKYVQYRLMSTSWSTIVTNWAYYSEDVYVQNPEWIRVVTDNDGRILAGIKSDGSVEWALGVPKPIKVYIQNNLVEINLELGQKVDKEVGKSLINKEYADGISYIENPEFFIVYTDNENRILLGIQKDGNFLFGCGIPKQITDYIKNKIGSFDPEDYNKIIIFLGQLINGSKNLQKLLNEKLDGEYIENPEYIEVETDYTGKVISGIKRNSEKVFEIDVRLKGKSKADDLECAKLSFTQEGKKDFLRTNRINIYDKYIAIGDSLTNASNWIYKVRDMLGINLAVKSGASGLTMAVIPNQSNSIYAGIQNLTADNSVELVSVWAGTNDFAYNVPIGDFETQYSAPNRDTSTFYGAYMESIEHLLDIYPKARIFLVGTTDRTWRLPGASNPWHDAMTENIGTGFLPDYVDAVKKLAERYSLPFIDLLRTSGINKFNITEYMYIQSSESQEICLHFNDGFGEQQIAQRIASFINSIG